MLLSPIKINRMELQNRVVFAPVHMGLAADDSSVTPEFMDFYLRRAKGGASMLVVGAVGVSPRGSSRHIGLYDDKFVPGLTEFTNRIHAQTEAKIVAQLIEQLSGGWKPNVHEVSGEEIDQIIENFEQGAVRAKQAGFDAIEIHGAHAYALASFLSLRNKRDDGYGGPVESRMRIVGEVYQRARKALGKDYPIGIRINGDEFIIEGNTLTHSTIIARKLAGMGIDYISVTAGGKVEDVGERQRQILPRARAFPYPPHGGYSGFRAFPPAYMPEGVNVYLAEAIRKALRQAGYATPVMTAGRIAYPELAETILKEGKSDLIGLARPLLREPDWPAKAKEGRAREIARCDCCNTCSERLSSAQPAYCKYEKD